MNALAIIAAANAALALAETLAPQIAALVASGEVTKEQQAQILARYQALKDKANEHFAGPEWEIES